MTKDHPTPVPGRQQEPQGAPGSEPKIPLDTTKGHRDDEKHTTSANRAITAIWCRNTSNRRERVSAGPRPPTQLSSPREKRGPHNHRCER